MVTADTSCSIRVEGIGNYTGEITADLKVFIRDWMAPDLTLAYTDIRVYKGSSASSSPQWSSVGPTAVYGIAPLSGGTLPAEIRIDPSSGDISVSSSAALQADTLYQVTATAIGSWKGWKKAEIRISVYDTFHYEFKPALVGQKFTLPAINAASFGQFAVNPSLPAGLDMNRDSGEISGTPTTRQLATEYTITASPTGGGSAISNKVYLFIQEQAVDKDDLWRMIDEEIVTQGNTADLGIIDTSIITDMSHLFNSYSWDISNNLANADYSAFNGDISGWDVSSVTDMSLMFYRAAAFNGDISGWDVSSVTNMDSIFWDTESFNGDISGWDVSKVTNMDGMFTSATNFNGDLSGWDVSSVTSMSGMFDRAAAFNGDISGWDVSSVTGMSSMFSSATNFNGDLSGWDVSSVISIALCSLEPQPSTGTSRVGMSPKLRIWSICSLAPRTSTGTSRDGMSPALRLCGGCSMEPQPSTGTSRVGMSPALRLWAGCLEKPQPSTGTSRVGMSPALRICALCSIMPKPSTETSRVGMSPVLQICSICSVVQDWRIIHRHGIRLEARN